MRYCLPIRLFFTALFFVFALSTHGAEGADGVGNAEALPADSLEFYYQSPAPDKLPGIFTSFGVFEGDADKAVIFAGFLSTLFREHPERFPAWLAAIKPALNVRNFHYLLLPGLILSDHEEEAKALGIYVAEITPDFTYDATLQITRVKSLLQSEEAGTLLSLGEFFASGKAAPMERILTTLTSFDVGRLITGDKAAESDEDFRSRDYEVATLQYLAGVVARHPRAGDNPPGPARSA